MKSIKTLSIDIETRSGTDLSKSGVYRYVEDPDFDLLLFGYSLNGGPVKVVDGYLSEIYSPKCIRHGMKHHLHNRICRGDIVLQQPLPCHANCSIAI